MDIYNALRPLTRPNHDPSRESERKTTGTDGGQQDHANQGARPVGLRSASGTPTGNGGSPTCARWAGGGGTDRAVENVLEARCASGHGNAAVRSALAQQTLRAAPPSPSPRPFGEALRP